MSMALKALIFDYGNVLSEPQNALEIESMAALLELPGQEFEKLYWRFRSDYDEARLEPRQYWTMVAREAGRAVSEPEMQRLIGLDSLSWMHPRLSMADWASALKQAGFSIALLSNMPMALRDALKSCSWMPDFQERTLSCDIKISKPSAGIYRHCLRRLDLAASEVLFLDDREQNVRAAQELGMHALQFTNPARLVQEIERSFQVLAPFLPARDQRGSTAP